MSFRQFHINGQSPADEGPAVPTEVAFERRCDFCEAMPTTHWITFMPTPRNIGFCLPKYLGACDDCAATIDFQSVEQLVRDGNCFQDEAEIIASYFEAITSAR